MKVQRAISKRRLRSWIGRELDVLSSPTVDDNAGTPWLSQQIFEPSPHLRSLRLQCARAIQIEAFVISVQRPLHVAPARAGIGAYTAQFRALATAECLAPLHRACVTAGQYGGSIAHRFVLGFTFGVAESAAQKVALHANARGPGQTKQGSQRQQR